MAKTLYLVRHAKSDWSTGKADFNRPLNKRGRRDAPEMGRRLKTRSGIPELIVCSPAERARQTLELLDLGTDAVFNENIYEASAGDLLETIHSLDDRYGSAMLIGHNPSMAWLASELTGEHLEHMPTCTIATIELDCDRWSDISLGPAKLIDLDYPKKKA